MTSKLGIATWGLSTSIHTDNPYRQGCKFWEQTTPIKQSRQPFPQDMNISLLQFCMKGLGLVLEVLQTSGYQKEYGSVTSFNKGCPSEGCCRIPAATGGLARRTAHTAAAAAMSTVATLPHRRLTYRAIFKIHCFRQEINSNGCLKRRKALVTASQYLQIKSFHTISEKRSLACNLALL